MTINNSDELKVCQRHLLELRARAEQIVVEPQKSRRVKDMELAGVRGMIEQLRGEIQAYELAQIQHTIYTLRSELDGIDSESLPAVMQRTLDVIEEVTHVLQPALGS